MNGNAGDGIFTLVGGIALLLLIPTAKHLAALAGAAVLYHLFNTNRNISDAGSEFINASVEWGLWVATIGAVLAFAGSITLWQEANSLTEDSSIHCRRGRSLDLRVLRLRAASEPKQRNRQRLSRAVRRSWSAGNQVAFESGTRVSRLACGNRIASTHIAAPRQ